jgi:PAS domain S-box-containing protein
METLDTKKDVFKPISCPEITKALEKETTDNALNIVVDAINSSVAGIIITDLDGKIRYANPAFCNMFDYVLAEIVGTDAAELFADREISEIIDVLSIINVSKNSTEEFTVTRKDGRAFLVEASASNVRSATGERVGRMASFVDITQRKMLEADLEKKLQEALDQLKVLRGILPICASCKRIRDSEGGWNQLEMYIKEHSEAEFSHGICPDCTKKLYHR